MNRPLNKLIVNSPKLSRCITLSAINNVKKVVLTTKDRETMVEGIPVESTRNHNVIDTKQLDHDCCPMCSLDLKPRYTDVLILSQYLNDDNKLIPFKESKLCGKKYYLIHLLIQQAQKCNLLPKPKDYVKFGPWEDLNHYVDFPNRRRDQPMKIIKRYWE